ncbi:hypothetical protein [Clostridium felsineum]|uniref:hypothetical protein n=1 Tax=Clostridium felsineum TaxID=36839 RepID=UPI00098C2150|nr:hypothetical protein [Clostridium felsineum]URZ18779.1 hypothetical protein CLFE_048670 [Clostridium felsineum DSM 794]
MKFTNEMMEYEDIREHLIDLEAKEQYVQAIKETKSFLKKLKSRGIKGYNRYFAYYQFSRYYFQLNRLEMALTNIKKAEFYCIRPEFQYNNYAVEANIYEQLGEYNKAIRLYNRCLVYYKSISLHQTYAVMMANIGHLEGNAIMIQRAINVFKKCENTWNYNNILNEMKNYLHETITKVS